MITPNFSKCTEKATELLYKQDVSNRILNIMDLKYDKNIIFDSIQNYCQYTRTPINKFLSANSGLLSDGCTLYDKKTGYYIILYNAQISYFEHRNWTLAHEIGHIYLNHEKNEALEEIEAHFFASQLFMPEYSLYMTAKEYGKITCNDVVEIFGVSPESAFKRLNTMRKKFSVSTTKKDKEIWDAQKERIDIYFDCKKEGSDYQSTLFFWNSFKLDYERELRAEMCAQMY